MGKVEKSSYRSTSKADNGLNRAYGLCGALLGQIRTLQTILGLIARPEKRDYGVFPRQPEQIGAILARVFKEIEGREKEKGQ